eukprot:11703-Pelagomonas_calceolata.AAC.2
MAGLLSNALLCTSKERMSTRWLVINGPPCTFKRKDGKRLACHEMDLHALQKKRWQMAGLPQNGPPYTLKGRMTTRWLAINETPVHFKRKENNTLACY